MEGSLAAGRAAKLRGLVLGHWGSDLAPRSVSAVAGGAAMDTDGRAFVLIDDGSPARFGPALAWGRRAGVGRLDVVVAGAGVRARAAGSMGAAPAAPPDGVVARRAAAFAAPAGVWRVEGTTLVEAVPLAAPAPVMVEPAEAPLLRDHGCEVVYEHGQLRGEVLGLEVARVVDGAVEVGVGRHDREARFAMRAGEDAGRALDEAVAAVRRWRRPGAARHPANTLRRSRWLRSVVCARPSLVGADWLEPVPPALPLGDLTDNSAAPCVGPGLVVACSVGVDLDLVPTAADCRLIYGGPGDRLVIVVPEGDDLAITRELAASLAAPAEVVTVPRAWPELAFAP